MKQEHKSLFEYLFDCARDDDVNRMKSMLKHSKPELVARYMRMHSAEHGCTLLQHAFWSGARADTLAYLMESGSDINDEDKKGKRLFAVNHFYTKPNLESMYFMISYYMKKNANIVNPQTSELLEEKEKINFELNQILRAILKQVREEKEIFENDKTSVQLLSSLQTLVEFYHDSNYWGMNQTSVIYGVMSLSHGCGMHNAKKVFDILINHGSTGYAGSQDALGLCFLSSSWIEWWKLLIDKGDMKDDFFHQEVRQAIDNSFVKNVADGALLQSFIEYYETKKEQRMLKNAVAQVGHHGVKTSFKI